MPYPAPRGSDEVAGFGPIEFLLKDPDVTEVMLVGPDDAFVKHEGQAEVVEGRSWHATDNIAIDDDPRQPRGFQLGQPMVLEDSGGARRVVTIVEVIGRSSLLIFR